MLALAPGKSRRKGIPVGFVQADAMRLPHGDGLFDICSIAFGIRNVADPLAGLNEMARVTKPGGHLMILEFGQVRIPLLAQAFNLFSRRVMPWVGGVITGDRKAYSYLEKSSAAFPCRNDFIALLLKTGRVESAQCRSLSGGIAFLYKAKVK